jgi:putative ABC transport system substrate-binding protein
VKEAGYTDGQNIVIDYRFGDGHYDRLTGLAAELIQLRPDVLVTVGTTSTTVIKEATDKIPIVCLLGDSVGEGFVASLARPGRNITGVSMMQGTGGLTGKRIELLRDALPRATRIGLFLNPDKAVAVASIEQAGEVARRKGLVLIEAPVRQVTEIDPAIATLASASMLCTSKQAHR